MESLEEYDAAARERLVDEPPKRVDAPVRTPFERDRARVVHAASFRRLAAKTQVVGPADRRLRPQPADPQPRGRPGRPRPGPRRWAATPTSRRRRRSPTTSATRRSATTASGCWPSSSEDCGGFEGNAQTLRLLTRLEAKTFDAHGRSVGPEPDPGHPRRLHEVPLAARRGRGAAGRARRRVAAAGAQVRGLRRRPAGVRLAARGRRRPAAVLRGAGDGPRRRRRLLRPRRRGRRRRRPDRPGRRSTAPAVWATVRDWYLPDADDDALDEVLAGLRARRQLADDAVRRQPAQPGRAEEPHQRPDRAVLRRRPATRRSRPRTGPFVRYAADLVVPEQTRLEIAVLKGIAAHYVMRADDRVAAMAPPARAARRAGRGARQARRRTRWTGRSPTTGTPPGDDAARLRVVIDQVASLTDASAVDRHALLTGGAHRD